MNEITFWKGNLPALPLSQRQLARQLNHMQYIAAVAKAAMDEMSNSYSYAEWKVATTHAVTAQLKQALAAGNITPEEEAAYRSLMQKYLDTMQQIGQEAAARFLGELQRIPTAEGNSDLVEMLRLFFGG